MSNDCPCEESLSILTNNNQPNNFANQPNNFANQPNNMVNQNINAMNNLGRTNNMMNTHNTRIVQNTNQNTNQNPINTNSANMDIDVPVINNKKEEMAVREQIRIILYIIVALSIHEAIKYFIVQSIRLNKGSSSRYLYYPAIVIFALVLINLF